MPTRTRQVGTLRPKSSPVRKPNARTKQPRGQDRSVAALTPEERIVYEQIPKSISHVPHPCFVSADTEEKLFGPNTKVYVPEWTNFTEEPKTLTPYVPKRTVLAPEDEVILFLRCNYARCRLGILARSQHRQPTVVRAKQMVEWFNRALKARANLVRANMALVLAMAKRTRVTNVEFSELVSEGNMALLRSVEKFDVSRGYRFSTYACRAILKSFSRAATKTSRYRRHFPTEFDPDLERGDYDVRRHEIQWEDSLDALREILAHNRAKLTDVERTIVRERFAIRSGGRKRGLAEVGKMVGLSKERVRQIQNLALGKIRLALD